MATVETQWRVDPEAAMGAAVPPAPRGPGLVAACAAINVVYAAYLGCMGIALPLIGASYHVGIEVKGRLFPATFIGSMAGVLVFGALSDRLGRKGVLLASGAAYATGLALFAMAPSFPIALLAAPLIGAGGSALQAVSSAAISDLYPARRAVLLNAMQVAFGVGAAGAPLVAARLLAGGMEWRGLYLLLAGTVAALLVLFLVQRFPAVRSGPALDLRALRAIVRRADFRALCFAAAIYAGAEVGFFSWMPTYFTLRLPGGARFAAWIVTLFWAGMTVGRLGTGALLNRIKLTRLRFTLATLGSACALLALAFDVPETVMLCVALTGLCFGGIYSLLLASMAERFSGNAGTAIGGLTAASNIGSAVVPWAVGAISVTRLGWKGALGLIPLCALVVAITALMMEAADRRRYAA